MTDLTGFDALIGYTVDRCDGDGAQATLTVEDRHLQPMGLLHGGVYASIAEAIASVASWRGSGKAAAGLANHTSFLRPAFEGDVVTAVAVPRHRGRTTWVWEVEFTNAEGKACALVRVTVALRDLQE